MHLHQGASEQFIADVFRWPWSRPDEISELVPDVRVGEWSQRRLIVLHPPNP